MNNKIEFPFLTVALAFFVISFTVMVYFVVPDYVAPDWAMEFFAKRRVVNAVLVFFFTLSLAVASWIIDLIGNYLASRK